MASLPSKQSLTMSTSLEAEKNVEKNAYQAGEAVPSEQDDLATYEIPPAETRKLLRTLDIHIAPVVMILYLIAFLDRANIGG